MDHDQNFPTVEFASTNSAERPTVTSLKICIAGYPDLLM